MRLLLSILFVFLLGNSFSQKSLVVKSKVKENEILLRWTPVKAELFKEALKEGYTIQRKEWSGSGNPPETFWSSELDFEIKMQVPAKDDSIWMNSFKKFPESGMLYSFLFPTKKMTKAEEENVFGLILLSCDLNPELAKLAGLFFTDLRIEKNGNYVYRISIDGSSVSEIIKVNSSELTKWKECDDFELKNSNGSAEISWNYKKLQSDYSGYFMERSMDSLYFERLNENAIVPMASQYEKNKEITYYSDTTVKENESYWYRMVGRDHFGEPGEYSPIKKIFIVPVFKGEIQIDTIYESEKNVVLEWNFSNEGDGVKAKIIQILRSKSISGKYELVKNISADEKQVHLTLNERENYLKVIASNEGSKIESWASLFLISDRIPPSIPDSLTGSIDRDGIVHLRWKNNKEKDFLGYRIFRSNSDQEEMVEVSKTFILKNHFEDSVDIKSLTEEIYFSVNAVDSNYNNSSLSVPIKLLKPDFIPPTPANIIEAKANEEGNKITWNNSNSRDVVVTELRRSKDGILFEKIFSTTSKQNGFLDTLVKVDEGFYYRTVVIDDANNFTESETVYLENSIRKIVFTDSVSVVVDRVEKIILLKWMPSEKSVYSYTVYKAKKGESMRSFKTVEGNVLELKDDESRMGNVYVYSVKATLQSGREVMIRENIEVEY